jgi:hypothetical protein
MECLMKIEQEIDRTMLEMSRLKPRSRRLIELQFRLRGLRLRQLRSEIRNTKRAAA